MAQRVKNLGTLQESWDQSLGWEDPVDKGMATHPSILAWRREEECGEVIGWESRGRGRGAASDTNPLRFGGYCKRYGESSLLSAVGRR